ncbi:MAG TPA: hypothetical protein DCR93_22195 [Cytophagales bacterium]|nr:hypothetical protein [Cytophagales bacterium]
MYRRLFCFVISWVILVGSTSARAQVESETETALVDFSTAVENEQFEEADSLSQWLQSQSLSPVQKLRFYEVDLRRLSSLSDYEKEIAQRDEFIQQLEIWRDEESRAEVIDSLLRKQADQLLAQGSRSYRQGKYDAAHQYLHTYQSLIKSISDPMYEVEGLNLKGVLFFYSGDLDSAALAFEIVSEKALMTGDSSLWKRSLGNAATIYKGLGRQSESLALYQQLMQLGILEKDTASLLRGTTGIGQVYYGLHDDDSAQRYFRWNVKLSEQVGDEYQLAFGSSDLADIFKRKGEWDSAGYYYRQSLDLRKLMGDVAGQAYVLERLGDLHYQQGMLDIALVYIDSGLAISVPDQLAEENLLLYSSQAKIFVDQGKAAAALGPALESMQWADSTGRLDHLSNAAEAVYIAYEALGRKAEAFDYLKMYQEATDSIGGEATTRRIARLEYQYQAEKDRALREAEAEKERSLFEARLRLRNWVLVGVIIISALAVWLAFTYRRFFRRQQSDSQRLSRLVQQLEVKNEELIELRLVEKERSEETLAIKDSALAAMAMTSHEKDAILEQITQRVQRLEEHLETQHKSELRSIYKDLNDTVNKEESWDSFLHRFEAVHPHFFERLKRDYPVLTNNDLKISAYVKVGMTNKDIAQVTHLAVASVKKNLNRLKKKLSLTAEDSIRDFMLEY